MFLCIYMCVCVCVLRAYVCARMYVYMYVRMYVCTMCMRASPVPSLSPKNHGARAEKQSGVHKGASQLLLLSYHRLPKVRIDWGFH